MSIRRNVVANHLGQGWAALVTVACLPLYVTYLGAEAFGLVGAFAILQAALSLVDTPIAAAVNREMARFTAGRHTAEGIRTVLRTLEGVSLVLSLAVLLLALLLRGYLAEHWFQTTRLSTESVRGAVLAMAAVAALRIWEGLYRGALYGLQRQVQFSAAHALLTSLKFGGALAVVALVSPTVEAFFLWQAGTSILAVAVLAALVYRHIPAAVTAVRWSRRVLAEIRGFSGGVMGITVIALALTQADKIVLSRLLTLEAFGYYTLAVTLGNGLYKLSEPVMDAVYPRFIELGVGGDVPALSRLYHQVAQLVSVLTAPAALVLSVFSAGVLVAWTGDRGVAVRTAPILSVFVVGVCLNCFMTVPYRLQLAHGWTSLTLITNILCLAVIIPAVFWVAPRFGPLGAAALWTCLNLVYFVGNIPAMHRRLLPGEARRYYTKDVLVPVAAAGGALVLVSVFEPDWAASRLEWAAFLVAAGALSLFAAALGAPAVRRPLLAAIGSTANRVAGLAGQVWGH